MINSTFNFFTLANSLNAFKSLPHVFSLFSIKDAIDIFIVAICIYLVLIFIKQTQSFFIFGSIVVLFGIDFLARTFNLGLTRQLFQPLLTFFVAIFVLVFQPEIRKFFKWFASGRRMSFSKALVPDDNVQTLVRAAFEMAKKKIGAIVVLPGDYPLDDLVEGGFPLEGKISFPLILSIFDPTSPGHDGAVLVEGSIIKAFGLHLPLAREFSEYARVGTRHRAAAGITERTDALAIIVSEERGEVSISRSGKLIKIDTPEKLADAIHEFMKDEPTQVVQRSFWHYFVNKNAGSKVFAFVGAVILWSVFVYQAGVVNQEYDVPIEFHYVPTNLTVAESIPTNVKVTISGNNTDIENFKDTDLHAIVDLKDVKAGNTWIKITKDNIKIPSYLDLTSITPKDIEVVLK